MEDEGVSGNKVEPEAVNSSSTPSLQSMGPEMVVVDDPHMWCMPCGMSNKSSVFLSF